MASLRPGLKIISKVSTQISEKRGAQYRSLSIGKIAKQAFGGPGGRCGIPPLEKTDIIKKERKAEELAKNLQTPSCVPRGLLNSNYPPVCVVHEGLECPEDASKYKYPAYSECRKNDGRDKSTKESCNFPPQPCEINIVRNST